MSYVTQTAMHEKTRGVEMVWCSDSLGVALLFRSKGKVRQRQSQETHVMEAVLTVFEA